MSPRRACALLGVVDSDTLRVEWEGRPRFVRLMDVCPERARAGGLRQATAFGRKTRHYLKNHYLKGAQDIELDILWDEPALSNSGKILAYIFNQGENINLRLVSEGWSPLFDKYGYPLCYCTDMYAAEQRAAYEGRGIWGELGSYDYAALKSYWSTRAGQIEGFRHARHRGQEILDGRLHYREIVQSAEAGTEADIFADVAGAFPVANGATLLRLGSPQQPLYAFFPHAARDLAGYVERRHAGQNKANYVYLSGNLTMMHDQPQIVIERLEQVSACPPRAQRHPQPIEV